ncbi:MAG TPA: hypothetical protein DIU20_02820 [Cryomorphaceae bacterium]|nr:hypothetical protein [Cryomorphaceae bacterium]
MSVAEYLMLFGGGLLAGVINTLAGNGSAITLSLLIFTGMPANVANATNRIGALLQTFTAVVSLRRTKRTGLMFRDSFWFIIPSILGSIIGAFLAVDIDPDVLQYTIGGFMVILLFTLLNKPKKWLKATNVSKSHKTTFNWIAIFLTAVYGGFIQMGIGIILLSVLVLVAEYSLRDANIIKLVLTFIFVVPAFFIFWFSGDMRWEPGFAMALGQGIGAVVGARYILYMPKANLYVRWLLIVILSVSAVVLLNIPQVVGNFAGW